MGLPFADCGPGEVCARVIRRLAQKAYRDHPSTIGASATRFLGYYQLDPIGKSGVMATALAAARVYVNHGGTLKDWCNEVTLRSRAGFDFRRTFFPEYKRNRPNPRVTNRGVRREHTI